MPRPTTTTTLTLYFGALCVSPLSGAYLAPAGERSVLAARPRHHGLLSARVADRVRMEVLTSEAEHSLSLIHISEPTRPY